MPKGGANIARAVVTLPKTEFLAQEPHQDDLHPGAVRGQGTARRQSIYGYAKAWSPLLDKPLEGPVYLRSSNNELPDLVASLDGQIHVDLVGSHRLGQEREDPQHLRPRPRRPGLQIRPHHAGRQEGPAGQQHRALQGEAAGRRQFDGQNGKTADSKPLVKVDCGKSRKGKRAKK